MRFAEFLRSLRSSWGLVVAVVAVGPLAISVPELQPLWPRNSGLIAVVACCVAVWVAWGLVALTTKHRLLIGSGVTCMVLGLGFGTMYLMQYGEWVEDDISIETEGGVRHNRIVVGTEIRSGIRAAGKSRKELLLDHEYDPTRVWTERSIRRVERVLLALFVATFFLLTVGSTVLCVALNRPRRA